MDKFPEAFKRFKEDVNVNRIKTFKQLELIFGSWSGKKWRGTWKQTEALARQARRLKIPTEEYRTREQQARAIFGKTTQQTEIQEIKFSRKYSNFRQWQDKTARTTAYQRRIISYLRNHPNATLQQARGHAKR